VAAACPGNLNTAAAGRLFFVYDAVSARKLLVDTGSSFSIFPFRSAARPSGPRLKAANGQRVRCWGSRRRELRIAEKVYKWQFLQADVSFPILGADFLRHFDLLVDVAGEQLVQRGRQAAGDGVFAVHLTPATHHPAAGGPDPSPGCGGSQSAVLRGPAAGSTEAPSSVTAAATADWLRIVAEFPVVVQPFTVSSSPKHGVEHHIETTGRPVTAKFRRLDQVKLKAAKEEFAKMLAAGVIRRSSSCWSSPLHMVRKKDGTWRPCGDFRQLNLITTEDRYLLPNMADLSSRLDGCTIFSKLDLQKGYLQVPVKQQDVPKTVIITPFG
jgi:hypothetical protein